MPSEEGEGGVLGGLGRPGQGLRPHGRWWRAEEWRRGLGRRASRSAPLQEASGRETRALAQSTGD
ncbi:hypothetical protein ACFPH6_14320 [Streptomyces xiangluensis]|uniref:Uncharacterized protein n=1 Tax=Streptomyces xiangluensis TaxID=2665720 RepID=A0ABV8YPH8_9ACTN